MHELPKNACQTGHLIVVLQFRLADIINVANGHYIEALISKINFYHSLRAAMDHLLQ